MPNDNSFKKMKKKFLIPETDKTCKLNAHSYYGNF